MKKFVNLGIGMVLIVVCLLLCCCGQNANRETEPTGTQPPAETESETKKLCNYSRIIVQSPHISSAIKDQTLSREGIDMRIYAYDYNDITAGERGAWDAKEHAALLAKQAADRAGINQDPLLSEEERAVKIAQLDSEFETQVDLLKSRYQSKKYRKLSDWFADRGVESEVFMREGQFQGVYLIADSVMLDDLIALEQSGLHFYYVIQWTEPENQPDLIPQN